MQNEKKGQFTTQYERLQFKGVAVAMHSPSYQGSR